MSLKISTNFYRRILPPKCIAFSSNEGIEIFKTALDSGTMKLYFQLSQQLRTQDEPAYCGLSSLVIVLNAFGVDPGRTWKGVWRWYHEDMLECCTPLEVVKLKGVTLKELTCIAKCNQLNAKPTYVENDLKIEEFREKVKQSCQSDNLAIVASFSRKVFGQTGTGHFAPIGGYNPDNDMALILEPARFKYPPFWVKLELLYEAINTTDQDSGTPRGYIELTKSNLEPTILFRIEKTFTVFDTTNSNAMKILNGIFGCVGNSIDQTISVEENIKVVSKEMFLLVKKQTAQFGFGLMKKRFTKEQLKTFAPEHQTAIQMLVKSIESQNLFKVVNQWVPDGDSCSSEFNEKEKSPDCATECLLCTPHYLTILLHVLSVLSHDKISLDPLQILSSFKNNSYLNLISNHIENSKQNLLDNELFDNEIEQLKRQFLTILNLSEKEDGLLCCIK